MRADLGLQFIFILCAQHAHLVTVAIQVSQKLSLGLKLVFLSMCDAITHLRWMAYKVKPTQKWFPDSNICIFRKTLGPTEIFGKASIGPTKSTFLRRSWD